MSKIDNSTYKAIKKDNKAAKKRLSSDAGCYGHIHSRIISRLILSIVLLLMIVADVIISLLVFHTRKTWFIILACILSIPFARNIIDLFMCFKCKPLDKEEYEKVHQIEEESGRKLLYDISITDEDGLIFVPALILYNNNIIAYTPDVKEVKGREKIKRYINMVNESEEGKGYRIVVTDNLNTFRKEINKIKEADNEAVSKDHEMSERLLSLGF